MEERFTGWHRANFDALLNFDRQFGEHGLKAMAGWHTEKYDYTYNQQFRKNFPTNDLTDIAAGDAATKKNNGYTRELAMISWFGRINYDYAGKYLLEGNIRSDASSRFADGNRWGYFPSSLIRHSSDLIQYNPNKETEPNRLEERLTGWHRANFEALLNFDRQFGLY